MKDLIRQVMASFSSGYTKREYMEQMVMLYEIFNIARREGLVGLESHIEKPHESEVIARYPQVFKYQVVVTRENHQDEMTFWVELGQEEADRADLKNRLENDIKELLTIKGTVKIVDRGTIPDFHETIVDRRKWD